MNGWPLQFGTLLGFMAISLGLLISSTCKALSVALQPYVQMPNAWINEPCHIDMPLIPPPLCKHVRGPKSPGKTAVQRPPRA